MAIVATVEPAAVTEKGTVRPLRYAQIVSGIADCPDRRAAAREAAVKVRTATEPGSKPRGLPEPWERAKQFRAAETKGRPGDAH